MQQREVTDKEGITWTCVQAYAGANGGKTEKATELTKNENNQVPVVCTPGGGAQTVRTKLPGDWINQLSDDELLSKIESEKQNS